MPLNGRDASVLALLAQKPDKSKTDVIHLVESLRGRARRVAETLIGRQSSTNASVLRAVEGLRTWAESLKDESDE